MTDMRSILERGVGGATPPPDGYERMLRRGDRKRRNQRIRAGVVGIVAFMAVVWMLLSAGPLDRSEPSVVPGGVGTGRVESGAPASTSQSSAESEASCQAFIAGHRFPGIQADHDIGSLSTPLGMEAAIRETRQWIKDVGRIIQCTADQGPVEGGDHALVQYAMALVQMPLTPPSEAGAAERTARAAMRTITDSYATSCYVPLARTYLRTGTIDVNLMQPCL